MITETDEIAEALAAAASRWPGLTSGELLRRLVAEGHTSLRESQAAERAVVARTAGALTGVYSADYLAELREEWPA